MINARWICRSLVLLSFLILFTLRIKVILEYVSTAVLFLGSHIPPFNQRCIYHVSIIERHVPRRHDLLLILRFHGCLLTFRLLIHST